MLQAVGILVPSQLGYSDKVKVTRIQELTTHCPADTVVCEFHPNDFDPWGMSMNHCLALLLPFTEMKKSGTVQFAGHFSLYNLYRGTGHR